MREIKFRAWNPTKKTMGKPFDFTIKMKTAPGPENCYDKFPGATVFMQYTGLRDKNGVEIYEGDVLLYSDEGFKTYLRVSSLTGRFVLLNDVGGLTAFDLWYENKSTEVIGNIYENPELLDDGVKGR